LTDLHISGRIGKRYFEQVVDYVNDARPDIIAITGDIVERDHCIDWIPETLGRLRAPRGVYFVLGNHDRRVDRARLTARLAECGLIHLGGQTRTLAAESSAHSPIFFAGNELPWQGPAPSVPVASCENGRQPELRILLAHTPDEFAWARAHDFHLVLAGHNHGGQVCVPLLGAVLVPSRHGTRYASGVFAQGKSVMHVSRGTSSYSPIRYNCPPEIAILVLQREK
jgi:predicted MPP superfamily phosphohydrolase